MLHPCVHVILLAWCTHAQRAAFYKSPKLCRVPVTLGCVPVSCVLVRKPWLQGVGRGLFPFVPALSATGREEAEETNAGERESRAAVFRRGWFSSIRHVPAAYFKKYADSDFVPGVRVGTASAGVQVGFEP